MAPKTLLRALLLMVSFGVLMVSVGCARVQPAARTVKVAVLDGPIEYEVDPNGQVTVRGWWFGAHDRFQSPNSNALASEAIARELDKIDGVEIYSREDLQIYMSQKERLLRRRYPSLSSAERKMILTRQDALDYGRSLNVDYVVIPTVQDSVTVVNRTISWWYSHAEANVQIYDTLTGNVVFGMPWEETNHFSSQLGLFEQYARKIARKTSKADTFRVQRP